MSAPTKDRPLPSTRQPVQMPTTPPRRRVRPRRWIPVLLQLAVLTVIVLCPMFFIVMGAFVGVIRSCVEIGASPADANWKLAEQIMWEAIRA